LYIYWPKPLNSTGGDAALKLRAHLIPASCPRGTPVHEILSPSLGAHIGLFWSAAATKCGSLRRRPLFQTSRETPRARALCGGGAPRNPYIALKLGGRTSHTGFFRGFPAECRRARGSSAAAPPVRLGGSSFLEDVFLFK
jgi:hypothetical protein